MQIYFKNTAVLRLLLLVFAFAEAFKHGETGFFSVGHGERLELDRGTETGNEFANRFFAGGTGL